LPNLKNLENIKIKMAGKTSNILLPTANFFIAGQILLQVVK